MIRLLTAGVGLLSVLAAQAVAADEQGVDLARLAGWDIVVDEDARPAEAYAAEEFRTLFAKASGVELPITKTPDRLDRHVFIGAGKAMQVSPVGFAIDKMGPEDLRIIVRDDLIAIAGGRPRGTLYGVYAFLEDYLGVRFLTADHVHVPRLKDKAVVGPLDRSYHPPLSFRWSYYGENNTNPAFAARVRVNTIDGDPKYGGKSGQSLINHSFGAQIPSATYGKDHPEYYALREGKRHNSGNDWTDSEPCLTEPGVLKVVTEAVLADLKAHPEKENISVSQNDNDKNCQCPRCKAIDDAEGTPMGTLLTFVNAVADAVAKEHPNVKVGTLSYWYTRKPPKTIKPRPNVQIQLCSIECCIMHPINDPRCEKNVAFCSDMAEWGKLTDQIFIWNYNTNFANYLLPFPNWGVMEPNIRYFVEKGAKGVFMQAAGNTTGAELSDLRNYVIANLLWDPTRSEGKLMHEFLDLHYGPAAPPIRKFMIMYHDYVWAQGIHRNCFGRAKDYGINEKIAEAAMDAFAQALTLADDDEIKARVEKASICAYRAAVEPAWDSPDDKPLDPDLIARMRPLAKQLFELCARYKVPMWNEGTPIADAKARLRSKLGLKDGEAF